MREMLYEHNRLNGFVFVLIEFSAVALASLFVSVATFIHGRFVWSVGSMGVVVNAIAVCATVVQQIRRGERSSGLMESFSPIGRRKIRREHPHLFKRTLQIAGAAVTPFLLAILTVVDRPSRSGTGSRKS